MAIDPKHYVTELEHPNGYTVSWLLLTSYALSENIFSVHSLNL